MTREELERLPFQYAEATIQRRTQALRIVELETELTMAHEHIAEQRAVIERLDQLTTMQDGGIRSLHEQIVQKDAEIEALKAQLAAVWRHWRQ